MHRFIKRRIWVTLVAGLLLLGSAYVSYRVMLSPALVRQKATRALSDMLGVPVQVGRATFHPLSGLDIDEIVVPVEIAGRRSVLLEMHHLHVAHYLGSLFAGRLNVRELRARDLKLFIERDPDGNYNIQPVLDALRSKPVTRTVLPFVSVQQMQFTYLDHVVVDKQGRPLQLDLKGLMATLSPRPGTRRLNLNLTLSDPDLGQWDVRYGSIDVDSGEVVLTVRSGDLPVTETLARRMGARGQEAWDFFGPPHGGSVSGVLFLTYLASRPQPLWFRAEVDVKGVSASAEVFPFQADDLYGKLVFTRESVTIPRLVGRSGPTSLLFSGTFEGYEQLCGLDLRIEATRLVADDKLHDAFRPEDRKVYELFSPTGQADASISIRRARGEEHVAVIIDAATCNPAADPPPVPLTVTYRDFPYKLTLTGRGRYNDGMLIIDRDRPLLASHGEALLTASGAVVADEPNPRVDLDIRGVDLDLDSELYDAIPQHVRPVWDFVRPSGSLSASLTLSRTDPNVTDLDHTVTLTDLETVFAPKDFPCSLTTSSGSIVYEMSHHANTRGTLQINDVKGTHLDTGITVAGTLTGFGGPNVVDSFDLNVAASNLRLTPEFRLSLPEQARLIWDVLNPDASSVVSADCNFTRPTDAPDQLDYRVRVNADDLSIAPSAFAYPIAHLHGSAEYRRHHRDSPQGEVLLHDLHTDEPGRIEVSGRLAGLAPGQPPRQLRLTVRASQVPLDDKLRAALPEDYRKTFDSLRPTGFVDVLAHLDANRDVSDHTDTRVLITARDASLCYDGFPLPVTDLTGRIEITADQLRFTDLAGHAAGGTVSLSGTVRRPGERSIYDLSLHAEKITLDPDFARFLPAAHRSFFTQVNPSAKLDLALNVSRRWLAQDDPQVSWDGWARLQDASLTWGTPVTNLNGAVTSTGVWDKLDAEFTGKMDLASVTLGKFDLTDLKTSYEKRGPRLSFHDLDAAFYDGRCRGQARFRLDSPAAFAGTFDLTDVQLEQVGSRILALDPEQVRGKLSGHVEFQGLGPDPDSLVGRASLNVRQGKLWELPVILAVLNVLNIPPMDRTAFTEANADVELFDRRFHVRKLDLLGSTVSIYGEGTVSTDGELDLSFLTGISRFAVPDIPLVAPLVKLVQKQIMLVQVSGATRDPDLELQPVAPVTETLKGIGSLLFGDKRSVENPEKR